MIEINQRVVYNQIQHRIISNRSDDEGDKNPLCHFPHLRVQFVMVKSSV
jgi:hypothetical protein